MSNIHSNEEAYEAIVDGVNYLIEHMETLVEVTVVGTSARIVFDEDAGKFFVQARELRSRESD